MQKYNLIFENVKKSQAVYLLEKVNGYVVINQGLTDATVNGVILHKGTATSSGESLSVGGNEGEIFNGRLDITIDTNVGDVMIIQKIYLENK